MLITIPIPVIFTDEGRAAIEAAAQALARELQPIYRAAAEYVRERDTVGAFYERQRERDRERMAALTAQIAHRRRLFFRALDEMTGAAPPLSIDTENDAVM